MFNSSISSIKQSLNSCVCTTTHWSWLLSIYQSSKPMTPTGRLVYIQADSFYCLHLELLKHSFVYHLSCPVLETNNKSKAIGHLFSGWSIALFLTRCTPISHPSIHPSVTSTMSQRTIAPAATSTQPHRTDNACILLQTAEANAGPSPPPLQPHSQTNPNLINTPKPTPNTTTTHTHHSATTTHTHSAPRAVPAPSTSGPHALMSPPSTRAAREQCDFVTRLAGSWLSPSEADICRRCRGAGGGGGGRSWCCWCYW